MDKLKSVLSGEEARRDDRNIIQQMNQASTLGWGTRIKGFIACFVVGAACTVLGVCVLFLPKIGITLFIVFYTFGNICALCSTMFLMGPMKQLKRMCDKTRALATTLMLVSAKKKKKNQPPKDRTCYTNMSGLSSVNLDSLQKKFCFP
uniref:Vesicle transport protein n=1 Tax=Maylandia zebra TaxID=106582 RepID=A0A3P9D1C0_9CICH